MDYIDRLARDVLVGGLVLAYHDGEFVVVDNSYDDYNVVGRGRTVYDALNEVQRAADERLFEAYSQINEKRKSSHGTKIR